MNLTMKKKLLLIGIVVGLLVFGACGQAEKDTDDRRSERSEKKVEEEIAPQPDSTESQPTVDEASADPEPEPKNSPETYEEIEARLSKLYIGDEFTLGSYEQDGDLENGPEPIEWIVIDATTDYYVCVSKYVLDYRSFDEKHKDYYSYYFDLDIFSWLNSTFIKDFTNVERSVMGKTERLEPIGAKVNLPSEREVEEMDELGLASCAKGTEYLVNEHYGDSFAFVKDGTREHDDCASAYWIRYIDGHSAKVVSHYNANSKGKDRTLFVTYKFTDVAGVRPVIHIIRK